MWIKDAKNGSLHNLQYARRIYKVYNATIKLWFLKAEMTSGNNVVIGTFSTENQCEDFRTLVEGAVGAKELK